jgi:hypothetical protein
MAVQGIFIDRLRPNDRSLYHRYPKESQRDLLNSLRMMSSLAHASAIMFAGILEAEHGDSSCSE